LQTQPITEEFLKDRRRKGLRKSTPIYAKLRVQTWLQVSEVRKLIELIDIDLNRPKCIRVQTSHGKFETKRKNQRDSQIEVHVLCWWKKVADFMPNEVPVEIMHIFNPYVVW
jgi:hypothetical protein